jgi:pimeloyl-ACP methyl ester carboxylesterase
MHNTNVNGVNLEYEVSGSGEPVLLISTGPIADSFWPLLSEKVLVDRYRLVAYRQRRLNRATNGGAPVTFSQHAADAAALLGHLGIGCVHVVGHSTGAAVALQFAIEYPDVVRSLALLEPTLVAAPSAGDFFDRAGPSLAAYGSGDYAGAMAQFLSLACSLDWESCQMAIDKHVPGGVARAIQDADTWFDSYVPALSTWQFGPGQAAAISQPVLSVLGTETDRWFKDGDELLRTWFPQLEGCRIEGVAHLLHMQRPEPVARGIAEFLARHPMNVAAVRTGGDLARAR